MELLAAFEHLTQQGAFAERGFDVLLRNDAISAASYTGIYGQTAIHRDAVQPIYLEVTGTDPDRFVYYFMGNRFGAAMRPASISCDASIRSELHRELADAPQFDEAIGNRIADLFVPSEVQQQILASFEEDGANHLVIVHDRAASDIPWEALYFGSLNPALRGGVSRVYKASNIERMPERIGLPAQSTVKSLIIQDPTLDLPGAREECEQLEGLFRRHRGKVVLLRGEEATKQNVLTCLASERFDVLHFAGHAVFDKEDPTNSGIICHGHERLVAADLRLVASAPQLFFLNACESGRMRSYGEKEQIGVNLTLAEQFMLQGVGNFIGTFWPVADTSALAFAKEFYALTLSGEAMARAVAFGAPRGCRGRRARLGKLPAFRRPFRADQAKTDLTANLCALSC